MKKQEITLEQINRLRFSYDDGNKEIKRTVNQLIQLPIIKESNDYMLAQNALIAGYMWIQGMTEEGKKYIENALKFALYASDRRSLIDVYILAGNYATLDDGFSEALSWYYKALDLSETIDNQEEVPRIYNNIGTLFLDCKNIQQGINYMLEAERHSKSMPNSLILNDLYNNLAEAFLLVEDFERAKYYIELMEGYISSQSATIHQLNHLINKWQYTLYLGDLAQGETIFIQAKKLLKKLPYGNDYIVATLAIFDTLVQMNKARVAVEWLENDIVYLRSTQDYSNLKKYYTKLIEYYTECKNDEKRLIYIEKSYQNDIYVSQARLEIISRSLSSIVETRQLRERERIENKMAYISLNDENCRLLAVNNNLRFIHDIGVSILSTTNLEEIYDILLKKVTELFQVYEFAIGVLNEKRDALIFKYSSTKGRIKSKTREILLADTKAITVSCFLNNQEIIINDCEIEEPERYAKMIEKKDIKQSLIFLPIVVNSQPYGVMTIQHAQKNAFSSLHIEVFRLLATFASVSFKNAQHNIKLTCEIEKRSSIQNELEVINQRLDYLAQHDNLTGLYNRRTLEQVYAEQFEKARHAKQYLTVMILDIDFFKQYNDAYGHMIGDTCIIKVAETLKETLKRKQDFIARYGGDEFIIILPETDGIEGEYIAQNLVKAISNLKIDNVASLVSDFVTISLGAVSKQVLSEDTPDELLIIADKALYKVKKELGKNTYCVEDI